MGRAVRELDDEARYRIERELVEKLETAIPAVPLYSPSERVQLNPAFAAFAGPRSGSTS